MTHSLVAYATLLGRIEAIANMDIPAEEALEEIRKVIAEFDEEGQES